MNCSTCHAAMLTLGQFAPRCYWCPECGTLRTPGDTMTPKRVSEQEPMTDELWSRTHPGEWKIPDHIKQQTESNIVTGAGGVNMGPTLWQTFRDEWPSFVMVGIAALAAGIALGILSQ